MTIRRLAALYAAAILVAAPAAAQDAEPDHGFGPGPDLQPSDPRALDIPGLDLEGAPPDAPAEEPEEPPLSREERMNKLFAELGAAQEDAEADFIAEEIEALWRDSGSPTVDLLTDRATDALDMGETDLARDLIDGAMELGPEHAEAWAESARIALVEEELGRALEHIERAVTLEPRHYYALTELGIILEQLDSPQGAYEAYTRALELNPRLPDARAGAERTEREAKGREL